MSVSATIEQSSAAIVVLSTIKINYGTGEN